MPLQAQQGRFWTAVDESPPEPLVREEGEGAPPRPDEAGGAEK